MNLNNWWKWFKIEGFIVLCMITLWSLNQVNTHESTYILNPVLGFVSVGISLWVSYGYRYNSNIQEIHFDNLFAYGNGFLLVWMFVGEGKWIHTSLTYGIRPREALIIFVGMLIGSPICVSCEKLFERYIRPHLPKNNNSDT
jgi:hypothetical protein